MADSDIKISALSNGTLTTGSLFVAADENSGTPSGYSSGKHSAGDMGLGILGQFQYTQQLQTAAKTIIGAINELAQAVVVLTGTLTAGNTTITFTDTDHINDGVRIDVYTSVFGVDPTNIVTDTANHICTLTFEAQQTDVTVKLEVHQ